METENMEKTETKAEEVSKQEPKQELDKLIRHHVWASIGIGLVPIPLVDMVGLTAIQVNMVRKIAKVYEIPFLRDKVKNIVGSLIGSAVPTAAGAPLAASITKSVPIIGWVAGAVTMPVVAGAATYAVGKIFVQHFASGGTFLTFDPDKVKDYYAEMLEEGRGIAKEGDKLAADVEKNGNARLNKNQDTDVKNGGNAKEKKDDKNSDAGPI